VVKIGQNLEFRAEKRYFHFLAKIGPKNTCDESTYLLSYSALPNYFMTLNLFKNK